MSRPNTSSPTFATKRLPIDAALYPDETMVNEKYLYFCAKDPESGELYFSRTLDQHNRAVEAYAPLWEKYDADRGIQ